MGVRAPGTGSGTKWGQPASERPPWFCGGAPGAHEESRGTEGRQLLGVDPAKWAAPGCLWDHDGSRASSRVRTGFGAWLCPAPALVSLLRRERGELAPRADVKVRRSRHTEAGQCSRDRWPPVQPLGGTQDKGRCREAVTWGGQAGGGSLLSSGAEPGSCPASGAGGGGRFS